MKLSNPEKLRRLMVKNQLLTRGIKDDRVLHAMAHVPREEFVPEQWRDKALQDGPLPIGCDQTISQPFTVAFMCEAAKLTANDKVLEIGTGSGYGAAVLSMLCREVHTVERIRELSQQAALRLKRLGYENIHVHQADGTLGLPTEAPFDAIVVTAGAASLPEPLLEQLSDGGRIVIPIGPEPRRQIMNRFTLKSGDVYTEDLGEFAFVPLIGKHAWQA